MSYILDALTKSQKERKRTTVPTLATEYPFEDVQPNASRRWTSIAIIALASIAMLIALYALIMRPPTSPVLSSAPTQESSQPESALSTTQSVISAEGVTPMASASSSPREEKLLAARVETLNRDTTGLPSPPSEKSKTTAHQPSRSSSSARPAASRAQKREGSKVLKSKSSPSRVASRTPSKATTSQSSNVGTSLSRLSPELRRLESEMLALRRETERAEVEKRILSATAPPPTPGETTASFAASTPDLAKSSSTEPGARIAPPTIRELPPDVRAKLPPLQIIAHAYAQATRERMVIINMKRYGEGDRMREGPLIDAITPTGVLLTFQGRQFQVPAR